MTKYFLGDWRTGTELRSINVVTGPWDTKINSDDSLTVTVSRSETERLGLLNTATAGKAMLFCADGDVIHAGGPIWVHDWADDGSQLTMTAGGAWSWLNHVLVLPELEGRLPTDPTTDTRFMPVDDGVESGYPWPVDTRSSEQGIIVGLIAQALTRTGADLPFVLPDPIDGEHELDIRGTDMHWVGQQVEQITRAENGPEIRFRLRYTTDRLGVEVLVTIGTPDEPMLYSPLRTTFNPSAAASSVSALTVKIDASRLASNGFATGGRRDDTVLFGMQSDSTLIDAGFPLMEASDTSHSSVTIPAAIQSYADELVVRGRQPLMTFSFSHQTDTVPYIGTFDVGDFCTVNIGEHPYLPAGEYVCRITAISGDADGRKVRLSFQPDLFGFTPAPVHDGYGTGFYNPGPYGG